jgi:hypothetical protein
MSDQEGELDICSDCGVVGALGADLLRCGRRSGDEWLVIQLCRPCLAYINPHILSCGVKAQRVA